MRGGAALVVAAAIAAIGCDGELPARPQVVLYVDTDLPVPSLADTLRIDHLAPDGSVRETRQHVLPNPSDWPVSVGVLGAEEGGPSRIRLRLFPATRAEGEPAATFTVNRLVELDAPARGIELVRVLLGGACLGIAADAVMGTTCLPAENGVDAHLDAPPALGLEPLDRAPVQGQDSSIDTWPDAAEVPCVGEARVDSGIGDGERCIQGGVFFLGDDRFRYDACSPACDTVPERLVRMSPFFLDDHEVTVGRWRAALGAGFVPSRGSWVGGATSDLCTHALDGSHDALPMSCVTWQGATEFCAFDGGRTLVSEAQFDFAASGRGEERLYTWGDDLPTCEHAAYARLGPELAPRFGLVFDPGRLAALTECGELGDGPAAVGTTPLDISRDGVRDLGGNLREWMRDEIDLYTAACWSGDRLRDPVCTTGAAPGLHAQRGASWGNGSGVLAVAWRDGRYDTEVAGGSLSGPFWGFRCARAVP